MSDIAAIAARLAPFRPAAGPFVVGVTGSVAVGKSTFAQALKAAFEAVGDQVELTCTDGFLHSNARLEELGLTAQKGFPASYDHDALRAALEGVRAGPTRFPGYSHVTYEVDEALARTLAPPGVLIIEGLTLRHPLTGPPGLLDALVYLEADEADLAHWFVARFMGLWEAAEHDPGSFYARFRSMSAPEAEAFGKMVWERINLPNLRDHIAPARAFADLVVRKAADHAIARVEAANV
ncbi:hypothetical protein [Phenylobacterium sp.]|uniref:type I pantothenate kinase n=1 Tax=Phenylobacterium sp. TaxID=1871053 RepID=UPI0027361994|nr:hypothetical protein [Phenylobacterium sp.]MDP3855143.1 hypothetical protein [Phenylobacterium sp.]